MNAVVYSNNGTPEQKRDEKKLSFVMEEPVYESHLKNSWEKSLDFKWQDSFQVSIETVMVTVFGVLG